MFSLPSSLSGSLHGFPLLLTMSRCSCCPCAVLAINNLDIHMPQVRFEQLTMVWAAMAPLVMARLLFVIIPL